jgi:Restriction Enzyme Adenine Methylase Associated/Type I restriction enzyme R protein N terminus (HSDR_N)
MADSQTAKLQAAIRDVVAKVQKFQDRNLGEQNTKASLIEPVLEALGWDIRDPDEVHREFKPTTQDKPVDYCLAVLRKPRLLVEAKPLGESLGDRKWIGQILGYASVAGVEWCVLTDGNEYRFYNATVPLDAEEKLFFQLRLSEIPEEEAARRLKLISRSDMADRVLETLWKTHYVDRRVKQALQELFEAPDRGVMRLIRRKVGELTPKQVLESLRRLDVRIESPSPIPETAARLRPGKPKSRGTEPGPRKKGKKHFGITLADVISAGLLSPPLRLFRKYRGQLMEASVLPDGGVEFGATRYDSCSTAAEVARSTVTGRRMHTNGWVFWQYLAADGKKLTLADAREAVLRMKGQ